MDGKVTNLNMDAFRTLKTINTRNAKTPLTAEDATQIKAAILKDNKIDAAEADLIKELTSDHSGITISAQKSPVFNPADMQFNKPVSAPAKAIISSIKVTGDTPDLSLLFRQGSTGIEKMLDIYNSSPEGKQKVTDFLGTELLAAWDKSNLGNGYGPLRDVIGSAYNSLGQIKGDKNAQARNMLRDSIAAADKKVNDAIPDFLYNWIRPGGYI